MEPEGSTRTAVVGAHAGTRDALAGEWRRLSRAATFVAVMTSPALMAVLIGVDDWPWGWALLVTIVAVAAFRGLIDILVHRFIPRPSLYGADREALLDDATARRRLWFWRGKFRLVLWVAGIIFGVLGTIATIAGESIPHLLTNIGNALTDPQMLVTLITLGIQLPLLFFINFAIIFGPLLYFGLKQMKGYEPGDADWGVRLEDVRGQAEPKEDVTRVIELWQSGEEFRKAGGKPERGLLFIGQPGTGKTMLSKAIATSFNSPIVTMPGSGFQQAFMGLDSVVVMFMIRKARKLARKWGGQCIIFIDEIDAVGLRRQALGTGTMTGMGPGSFEDHAFFGPWGAQSASGDLVLETRAWRERLFASRAETHGPFLPPGLERFYGRINDFIFPGGGMGGMGGGMALNQLLVQMDGVDEPPFWRKFWTNRINTLLDASYLVPRRLFGRSLRIRPPKPRPEQVYFIGATNVPIDRLDPALIRPGRMGRHVWFRTPTKDDRADIFDLYLTRVDHDPDLDTPKRRDELARITNGYSPAMIEQVCSMALTYAHSEGRVDFGWDDIVEAMTTIESGTAQGVDYVAEESRAVAIHEAGHAVASHVYMHDVLSTRLSIRKRGGSLGHHQAIEKEERFSSWRHEEVGKLVWTLGAMAAEHVFYGENSTGVGGDVQSATSRAAWMVGMCGMGPMPVDLSHVEFPDDAAREEAEREYMERFERIGEQILNRARGQRESGDSIASILMDGHKRRAASRILGQSYITAVCLVRHNRDQVAHIADMLVERKELHGDEVVELLDAARLEAPAIDITDETIWPKL
ncbi:AAA family ATPase [Baekduia soli]|uniref:AAA family ATPase n=1 Tax=Baekduia soli TaxID=496014 RepID=A0A5B8U8T9_9ACTN|nr:AAA family ATPase [Baekduia soli]QEC49474.1 AAA family ATPase [Baekduia soli]